MAKNGIYSEHTHTLKMPHGAQLQGMTKFLPSLLRARYGRGISKQAELSLLVHYEILFSTQLYKDPRALPATSLPQQSRSHIVTITRDQLTFFQQQPDHPCSLSPESPVFNCC